MEDILDNGTVIYVIYDNKSDANTGVTGGDDNYSLKNDTIDNNDMNNGGGDDYETFTNATIDNNDM